MLSKVTEVCKMDIKSINELLLKTTKGKFKLYEEEELKTIVENIKKFAEPLLSISILDKEDVYNVRQKLREILLSYLPNIEDKKMYSILLVFTEFATNMVKHAGGGSFSIYNLKEGIYMFFEDKGKGISIEKVPYITLANYSTIEGSLGFGFSICIQLCDLIQMKTNSYGTSILAFIKL